MPLIVRIGDLADSFSGFQLPYACVRQQFGGYGFA
jgi:hypothetical protein